MVLDKLEPTKNLIYCCVVPEFKNKENNKIFILLLLFQNFYIAVAEFLNSPAKKNLLKNSPEFAKNSPAIKTIQLKKIKQSRIFNIPNTNNLLSTQLNIQNINHTKSYSKHKSTIRKQYMVTNSDYILLPSRFGKLTDLCIRSAVVDCRFTRYQAIGC
ncbi:hypothetical protein ACOSQ3_015464 [Xanthoceras sorbifolium]